MQARTQSWAAGSIEACMRTKTMLLVFLRISLTLKCRHPRVSCMAVLHSLCNCHECAGLAVLHLLCNCHECVGLAVLHSLCNCHECVGLAVLHSLCDCHECVGLAVLHSLCNCHECVGLARTVYKHRIWPYIWWFPCQNHRLYIWFWSTLRMWDGESLRDTPYSEKWKR